MADADIIQLSDRRKPVVKQRVPAKRKKVASPQRDAFNGLATKIEHEFAAMDRCATACRRHRRRVEAYMGELKELLEQKKSGG